MKKRKLLLLRICLLLAAIGLGFRFYISFSSISNYPFPISWSESGRIYNAFQIYAPLLSQENSSLPWLDPARSILDGIILLVPGSQIWMWRFWIETLFILTTFLTAFLIVNKSISFLNNITHRNVNNVYRWLLILWGGLFLFQGPVYYHLLFGIIPVLWLYNHNRPRKILMVIAICAIWTGLSRVNWFLMPAIVASTVYLLSESKGDKTIIQYLGWPIKWGVINLVISGATYLWSLKISAQPSVLDPAMTYGFMRTKLWPNDGYWLGLVPGILLISFPALLLILYYFLQHRGKFHWIRLASLSSILVILGIGSTFISLRAGGGYDLHNYDTFLLILLLIGVNSGLGVVSPDRAIDNRKPALLNPWVISFLLILPIVLTGMRVKSRPEYPFDESVRAISQLNLAINDKVTDEKSSVLFIDHRHLLIYHLVTPLRISSPYEKIELMEMAMAGNKEYFKSFLHDVESLKYDLIVSEILRTEKKKPEEDPYWYENNVWGVYVTGKILQYYEPLYINKAVNLGIYIPKR